MSSPLLDEAKVLKARPDTEDDNSWPIFSLKDVEVFLGHGRKRKFEDLWKADVTHSLVVEGTLEKLPRRMWKHSLTNEDSGSHRIRLPSCTHWSYGQYEDDEIAFWAAGSSGWFEVRPSKAYSPSYKALKQAIECLYFSADFYRVNRKARGSKAGQLNVPLHRVFVEFAQQPKFKCPDEETARLRFYTHRQVLLYLMDKGLETDGWKWTKTELYSFLAQDSDISKIIASDDESQAKVSADESSPMSSSSSATTLESRRPAGKSKAGLRPKSAQRASLKSRLRSDAQSSGEESNEADLPSAKRKKSERGIDSGHHPNNDGIGNTARTRRGHPALQPQPEPEIPGDFQSPKDDESADNELLPLQLRSGRRRNASAFNRTEMRTTVSVQSAPLPMLTPNTPGMADTWTCPFDGCAHRIYAASQSSSVVLIQEHYSSHTEERQKKLDLVYAEERPYLPVEKLIKRIREMASAAGQRGT